MGRAGELVRLERRPFVDELERIERAAFRSLWQLAPETVAAELGLVSAEAGGATCVALRTAPTTMLNRALGVGVDRPVTNGDLEQITSFFTGRAERFAIAVAPNAQPESLADMLRERGFEERYAWMKFRRGTDDPGEVATDLRIEKTGPERGRDFGLVAAESFGLPANLGGWFSSLVGAPGWHCFVGYAGEEPAAAAALYVDGRAAWLGVAGTRPEFRGRGGQGALLSARLAAAKGLGAEIAVTETGERVMDRPSGSYQNILRSGFEEAYLRPNYELDA
jgi:GNAT superfamily N-acetyltransferase